MSSDIIILKKVDSSEEKLIVKDIISKFHSYVPTSNSVGRRIDWLIYENSDFMSLPIGMIGVGSGVYPPPKDILNHLNITKNEYRKNFNAFSNNWRFCMTTHIKNAGSRILKQLRQKAPLEWKNKYGDELKYLFTFVGGGRDGAVYKSDNWSMIGKTSGLPSHKSSSMKWSSKEELKNNFVKPTGENRKLIFFREL